MIRSRKRLGLCTALLIVNLAFIWGNSMLPGEVSGAFSDWVKELLAGFFPSVLPGTQGGGLLRKLAHFTEFCALGMCLAWLFGMLEKGMIVPLLCGFLTACADETIQRFTPDRNPSLMDVGIDTAGVVLGIILLFLGHKIIRKKNKKFLEDIQT